MYRLCWFTARKIGRLVFRQGFRPSCHMSLISTRSTLVCILIPTSIGIAWDSSKTILCIIRALVTLKGSGVVGSTVGS